MLLPAADGTIELLGAPTERLVPRNHEAPLHDEVAAYRSRAVG